MSSYRADFPDEFPEHFGDDFPDERYAHRGFLFFVRIYPKGHHSCTTFGAARDYLRAFGGKGKITLRITARDLPPQFFYHAPVKMYDSLEDPATPPNAMEMARLLLTRYIRYRQMFGYGRQTEAMAPEPKSTIIVPPKPMIRWNPEDKAFWHGDFSPSESRMVS